MDVSNTINYVASKFYTNMQYPIDISVIRTVDKDNAVSVVIRAKLICDYLNTLEYTSEHDARMTNGLFEPDDVFDALNYAFKNNTEKNPTIKIAYSGISLVHMNMSIHYKKNNKWTNITFILSADADKVRALYG